MSQEIRRLLAARRRGRDPDAPELQIPRFSRGVEQRAPADAWLHVGRFSEGAETLPDGFGLKDHVGRFSEGLEALPDEAPGKRHVGRFSEGVERHTRPAA